MTSYAIGRIPIVFERDDFDWAYGELLELFERANREGIYPHELRPDLFHSAWSVLNAQRLEVRLRCHKVLVEKLTRQLFPLNAKRAAKRYANPFTQ